MATISFLIKVYVYLTIMFFLGNLPSLSSLSKFNYDTSHLILKPLNNVIIIKTKVLSPSGIDDLSRSVCLV